MSNLINIRFLVVLFIDFIIGGVSINFSSYIRLGSIYSVSSYETLIAAFIVPSIFLFFKIYKTSWRYFSLLDMWSLIRICMVANIFISGYAATSVSEYFARGFEEYFIGDKQKLKNLSPVLYRIIEELVHLED